MKEEWWEIASFRSLWLFALLLLAGISVEGSGRFPKSALAHSETSDPRVFCALSFTRSQLADSTHISILGQASWLSGFLETADIPVTLLQLGDERVPVHNLLSDVIFLLTDFDANASFVEEALSPLRSRVHQYHARVVVWCRSGDTQAAVEAAMGLDLVRLVVVSGSSGAQRVFRYHEDCVDEAMVAKAVQAGECGLTGSLAADGDLFVDLLHWNLQGCPLRISSMLVRPNPKGGYSFIDTASTLPNALAKRISATVELSMLKEDGFGEKFPNGTSWGAVKDLERRRFDVVYSVINRNEERERSLDLSPSFYLSCITFNVPSGLGIDTSFLALLHSEFPPIVWALVGLAYIMILALLAMSWRSARERPVQDAAFFALAAALGNVYVVPVITPRVRAVTVFWLIFCIILSTAYQAVLHSLEAAPPQRADINSLAELVDAGLPILGYAEYYDLLKNLAEVEGDAALLALSARFQPITDFELAVNRVAIKRDAAFFHYLAAILQFVAEMKAARGRKMVHAVPGFCSSYQPISSFALRRGSPYAPLVTDLVTRALEVGLLGDLASRVHQYPEQYPVPKPDWAPFSVAGLSAVFQLLLMGLVLGTLVFFIELLVNWASVYSRPSN